MLRSLLALFLLAAATQIAAAPAPGSTCTAPAYHQLDFWTGDWDTFDPDGSGPSEARTHVDSILGGCAIHELYEQTDGLIGDSFLSYDAARKVWQQTWVTNRGSLMVITGTFQDGTLNLEGEMHTKDGRVLMQRVSWKTKGAGVSETSVISKDGGKTWEPAFDVLFLRHADPGH